MRDDVQTSTSFSPPRRKFSQTIVLVAFLSLVAVPVTMYGCRYEGAKWAAAQAMNHYAAGNRELALTELQRAVISANYDPDLSSRLAMMLADNDRAAEGLELTQRTLEIHENSPQALMAQAHCHQHLNEPDDALATLKQAYRRVEDSLMPGMRHIKLNNLAYYRALAGAELIRARNDIEQVVQEQARSADWPIGYDVDLRSRTFVSVGLVARKLDEQMLALNALDREIDGQSELGTKGQLDRESESERSVLEAMYAAIQDAFPLDQKLEKRHLHNPRVKLTRRRDSLVFLLLVRALIHQDLGNEEASRRDRLLIRQRGYDIEHMLSGLPENLRALMTLDMAATYFDTYGLVQFQRAKYGAAQDYFDLAIVAAELSLQAVDSPLHNSSEEIMFDPQSARKDKKRTVAVLRYHRMQLNRRLQEWVGQPDGGLEEADARRIEELGFDPDARLF